VSRPVILLTGFEPFGGRDVNPSQLLVERLDRVEKAILPVSYARAPAALRAALDRARPDVVICFGQADGRAQITIERVALNLDDPANADEDGVVSAATIRPGGPVGRWSTLPVDEIVTALRDHGVPAAPSRDAGGFLCNRVFFELMEWAERERPDVLAGFVHLPLLPEQALDAAVPTMPLERMELGARVLLEVVESARARGEDQRARASA